MVHSTVFSLKDFFDRWMATTGLVRNPDVVNLIFAPQSEGACVFADPDALRVIVDNLIDNALKYTQEKPLELDIRITETRKTLKLAFSDNGPGFDPKLTHNLFEAFRRLTPELPDGSHGTGMGLHISRQLARAMGGDLTAQSDGCGQGATFVLTLIKQLES